MQAAKNILLIRPASFKFNPETAASNALQIQLTDSEEEIKQKKLQEFEGFVLMLKSKDIGVYVIDDTLHPEKPDAIFPNNWISFHEDGTVILYPMQAPNRRNERRQDILEELKTQFTINKILDLSKYEEQEKYLEGTGSMVFDHINQIAYACLSPRTDLSVFKEVCAFLNYQPLSFYAHDQSGKEIYHTNVMMCMAEEFCVICSDAITNPGEKEMILQSLSKTGHRIIDISFEQMNQFAGNMLVLQSNKNKRILALSQTAFHSLTDNQKETISQYVELVPLFIETIEAIGGGSARCMIAEIFLPEKCIVKAN